MDILTLLVFGLVMSLTLAVASLMQHKPGRRRLSRLADGSRVAIQTAEGPGLLNRPPSRNLEAILAKLAGRAGTDAADGTLRRRLVEAGFRLPAASAVYQGSRIALALVLPMILLLMSVAWNFERVQLAALLLGSSMIGLVGPSMYVHIVRAARQRKILEGLPDALDLLVVCVEGGLGINSALARVAKDFVRSSPTLAAEIQLVVLEVRAGKSSTEALRSLADRTGVAELGSLVAMLIQTERFGTSLADTLRIQADAMRVHRTLRAEEQAGKAPVKMLFPTLLIFIATMIVTMGPGLLRMFAFFETTAS
jgi:tight adherence protein C